MDAPPQHYFRLISQLAWKNAKLWLNLSLKDVTSLGAIHKVRTQYTLDFWPPSPSVRDFEWKNFLKSPILDSSAKVSTYFMDALSEAFFSVKFRRQKC